MYDLSYFNLGFRSDSVSNCLERLKSDECDDKSLLDDAVLIIGDCLKIKEESSLISSFSCITGKNGYESYALLPLLAELFLNKSIENMIEELKCVYESVSIIRADQSKATDKDYSRAISFFSELTDLCLSNSAHQINSEKLLFA